MNSIKMWYLIRAAVKNVRINLGQLRIKRQIDSKLCDSIFAAYVMLFMPVSNTNALGLPTSKSVGRVTQTGADVRRVVM